MIVKMSKYAFMVYHKEYDTFLSTLRDLGVVHIKETNSVMDNERLQELLAERKQINTLMRYFKNLHAAEKDVKFAPARELTKEEGLKLVRKIEELQDKKAQLIASKQSIEKDLAYMEIWGEFSYQNINRLKRAGYDVTFFTCPTAKYEPEWGVLYNAILINNFQSVTYFITITKEGTLIDIDAERPKMPVQGLAKLRARFWDVNAGKITIGGTDVRDFKLDSLMKNISMVFQSVYLFADTIENNIKFGCPDATHEQVVEAAKKACCHDFISALPDGYDTVIGEGGGTLSGGEKQRISIARAMLKDAPIIILDEATSSVDPENEDELQRAIEALTHDKTIIMIAHRLKTVRNADQILVLDNAHIVQRGTHAELIKQKGLYADFVSARQEAIGWKLAQ